ASGSETAEPSWGAEANVTAFIEGPGLLYTPTGSSAGLVRLSNLDPIKWTRAHLTRRTEDTSDLRVVVYPNGHSQQELEQSVELFGNQIEVGDAVSAYQAVRSETDFDGSGLPVGSIWHRTNGEGDVVQTLRYNGEGW